MKIKFNNNIILLLFILICACTKTEENVQTSDNRKQRDDSLKLKLNISTFQKTALSADVDSVIINWPVYVDLKNEINRLEAYTIEDVISNMSTLEKAVDSLHKTIPEEIDTFPVMSRVNVLNTKAKHLLMLSSKQTPKLLHIKQIAEELPLEFNALNIQLNEMFIELPNFEELNNE